MGLFVLLTGIPLVLAASVWSPFDPGSRYWQWVGWSVLTCLLFPTALLLILRRDVSHFGLRVGYFRRTLFWLIAGLPFVLLTAYLASRNPAFRQYYPKDLSVRSASSPFLLYAVGSLLYMFAWEFAFRGYLTFGLYYEIGWWAVVAQAAVFSLAHWGKLPIEIAGAFVGGMAQGLIALHTKSILGPFLLHSVLFLTLNALLVYG